MVLLSLKVCLVESEDVSWLYNVQIQKLQYAAPHSMTQNLLRLEVNQVSKCVFAVDKVEFCGMEVSGEGVSVRSEYSHGYLDVKLIVFQAQRHAVRLRKRDRNKLMHGHELLFMHRVISLSNQHFPKFGTAGPRPQYTGRND